MSVFGSLSYSLPIAVYSALKSYLENSDSINDLFLEFNVCDKYYI